MRESEPGLVEYCRNMFSDLGNPDVNLKLTNTSPPDVTPKH